MESTLSAILVLNRYMDEKRENLESRFYEGKFLDESELDSIRGFCQIKFRPQTAQKYDDRVFILEQPQRCSDTVSFDTQYVRLTIIAKYLRWLAEQIVGVSKDRFLTLQIGRMEKALKARRPVKKNRNTGISSEGLSGDQLEILIASPSLPFSQLRCNR